jgi:beta-galactosidase
MSVMDRVLEEAAMYVGVDYYPEHWPEERWETDASLMEQAGFNLVRLAEFSWALCEPEEGALTFDWLDRALAALGRHGIKAILGTPTGVMPAWVARKYPEALAVDAKGKRLVWGVRKNNCFSSGAFRLLSERVTSAMAAHFAATVNVVGWQTDNEFGGPVCHCEACRAAFQDWLRERYRSLEELNRAWGTHFWAHRFGSWEEIPLPDDESTHNPSLCLDRRRFHSWLNVRFQADQLRIIRRLCPGHFVTHNFMGLYSELDYYELARELDFVSWDNYPVWRAPEIRWDAAEAADVMRGLKGRNFWIMEQTAGPGGWGIMGRNPRPGEIRQVAFQQVAHGADGMVWFRWRTCTAGREQYWHGLLGHDGKAGRRYQEAARTAADLHRIEGELEGTTVRSRVAIVYDYQSIWAFKIQPAYGPARGAGSDGGANYHDAVRRYHRALLRAGVNVDMVGPDADLKGYKVVLAPHLYVLPDQAARRLDEYVRRGGVLLADCRTAVKDESSLCHDRTLPGLLSEALGIAIDEYEALSDDMRYTVLSGAPFPASCRAGQFADWVTARGAETLAGYEERHLKGYAALTRNRHGSGWAYYLGTIVGEDSFYDSLVAELMRRGAVEAPLAPPKGVEVSVREGEGRELLFLVNHTEEPVSVATPEGKRELLGGASTGARTTLEPYGVAVIRL